MTELKITSLAFEPESWIPNRYSGFGEDFSQELHIDGINEDAIAANIHILIALPLYVENVPWILLEFARTGCFSAEYAKAFAGPERIPAAQIRKYERFGCHLSKLVMNHIAKKLGCKEKLDARPYMKKSEGINLIRRDDINKEGCGIHENISS